MDNKCLNITVVYPTLKIIISAIAFKVCIWWCVKVQVRRPGNSISKGILGEWVFQRLPSCNKNTQSPQIMSKFDTALRKMMSMSTMIYVSRQFWSFISSCIKRNNYERPNNHHIVKISDISLQIRDMKLRILNQYPIFAKLLICSYKSVRQVSVSKMYNDLKTFIHPMVQNKHYISENSKFRFFYRRPLYSLY